jgi:exodeoxyribonuclease VII small subunit
MTQKDNEILSFERAIEELEKIVKTLEGGHDTLENSIALYERGMKLKKICEKKLEEASQLAEQQLARANKYFADLNKTTAEKNAAQEELARWSALRIQPNQVIALQQNLKKVGEEKAALVDQEKVLMRSVANLRNKLSKYEDDTQLVEMPGLRGQVLAIDPKWDFAIINVGSKQGAKEGGQVLVRRGDKLVGKLKIISVEEGRSVANILPAWKQGNASVTEGDAILY